MPATRFNTETNNKFTRLQLLPYRIMPATRFDTETNNKFTRLQLLPYRIMPATRFDTETNNKFTRLQLLPYRITLVHFALQLPKKEKMVVVKKNTVSSFKFCI
jgi:hypothetical protein